MTVSAARPRSDADPSDQTLTRATKTIEKQLDADAKELEKELEQAERESS